MSSLGPVARARLVDPRYAGRMLYLASRSPRRRQLLEQLGVKFETIAVDVVEQCAANELPADYVSRVARDKARVGLRLLGADTEDVVLGADTEVVLDDHVFGKPVDADGAVTMLRHLSARTHQVISTLWLVDAHRQVSASCISQVQFAPLDDADIQAYVATGEFFGKAGGYAIQGRAAAFIEHLSGSYSAVMGLPLFETGRLLRSFAGAAVKVTP